MTQTHINIAMLAHVDAGKTTLSEALLYKSGSIRKAGRVDNKDAFLDTNEMERNRGITIFSKQAVFSYGGCEFTLLDTPGHVDFSAEMERTLQVLDYAVLIISGADGVQGHTRTLWRLLARYDIPTFIFVNKMDQLGTDHEKLLDQIKDTLSSACVDFSKNEDGTYQDKDFYENVAVCNEKVLEAYLEGGSIEDESVREMIQKRELFPCFFGSALKMEGIEELLFALSEYTKMPEYPGEFGATVFKITRDAQGSRLTHLKVTGGVLKARNLLSGHKQNKAEDIWEEKVNQIRIYSGEKYETKDEVEAGTICAVTGLSYTYPGEGLGSQEESELPILEPVLTYELILPDGVQPQAMMPKLAMLEEEEPELHIVWNEELQEIRIRTGQPLLIQMKGQERVLPDPVHPYLVTKEDIGETMGYICHYSLYAYENELKQGFITVEGGHRIGVAGKVIIENEKVKNIQYISSLNVRISHEVLGCADALIPYITENKQICHTLIISPPCCGKTTLIRDLIRQISDGNEYIKGCSVGVVDERSELGGCYLGIAQNHLGTRTDILDCCPKAEGMIMLIRSMAPRVIAVDEIGTSEDIHAIEYAMQCGCRLIASVHSLDMDEASKKPILGDLIRRRMFQRYVVLGQDHGPGKIREIYDERGRVLCRN